MAAPSVPTPSRTAKPLGVETEWQLLLWNRSDDSQLLAAMSPVPFVFDATYYIIYIYICFYVRRKFRSQTSDNMDR